MCILSIVNLIGLCFQANIQVCNNITQSGCYNNGTCIIVPTVYRQINICQCPKNFTGLRCETQYLDIKAEYLTIDERVTYDKYSGYIILYWERLPVLFFG